MARPVTNEEARHIANLKASRKPRKKQSPEFLRLKREKAKERKQNREDKDPDNLEARQVTLEQSGNT